MTFFSEAQRWFLLSRPFVSWALMAVVVHARAEVTQGPELPPAVKPVPAIAPPLPGSPVVGNMYIREYRVRGSKLLNGVEIGKAVYPFLGPGRAPEDIDKAREALEKAYHDKGYNTVSVSIPPQSGNNRGIIFLQVDEIPVGRLVVKGARHYLPSDIKKKLPSLAPGKVPDFNQVQKEFIALAKSGDLEVTPELTPGIEPGTMDFELTVKDKLPLHGKFELNNRYNANTAPLRLDGGFSYSNLWQLGHTLGFNFQIAPERTKDAEVYSAYYTIPLAADVTLTFQGSKQNSDVATLNNIDSIGKGDVLGLRFGITLPEDKGFLHSLSVGMDYKHMYEASRDPTTGAIIASTALAPKAIDYYPFSLAYSASWVGKRSFTDLNASLTTHFRGMGSQTQKFDDKRYNADGSFIYFRGDLTHTHDLPAGMEVMAKVQGQLSNHPLINNEQYAAGGQSTVRGYLESTALGDSGVIGTLELRSPSFIGSKKDGEKAQDNEWRVYAFIEGGSLALVDPLPEQTSHFNLASVGIGTHLKLREHFNGSLDVALPLVDQGTTLANDIFVSFRVWADF